MSVMRQQLAEKEAECKLQYMDWHISLTNAKSNKHYAMYRI